MKKRIITVGLVAMMACLNHLKAQDPIYIGEDVYFGRFQQVKSKLTYKDIEGTPYHNEELTRGLVQFKSGDKVSYYMRYDMYADDMEYLDEERLFTILNMDELDYILLNGDKVVYTDYFINNTSHTGYLIQSVDDHCSLYQRHSVEFVGDKPAKSTYHLPTPAHFETQRVQWYYSCDSKPITIFSADGTGLKKISGSYSYHDQLKKYLKENKLKMKNEKDMIALFTYYNALIEEQVTGETK